MRYGSKEMLCSCLLGGSLIWNKSANNIFGPLTR